MKKSIIFLTLLILLVLGAIFLLPKEKAVAPTNDSGTALSVADYKNGTFEIDGKKITLKNGKYEESIPGSSSKMTVSYFGNEANGDINGDGKEDVSFLLQQNSGGTGTFYYLAVALKTDTGYIGTNAIFLGDRISPQTTEIKNGSIIVNYADRLPGEPFSTAPSQGVSKYFKIENGKIVEIKGEMGE